MSKAFRKSHNSGAELIVWKIEEEERFFVNKLTNLIYHDAEFVNTKFAHKRLELLAARYAAKILVEELGFVYKGIAKDEYGKPFLVDSELELSLTHTQKYVAVAIHRHKPLGIDLEKPSTKMWKIKERLFTEDEIDLIGDDLDVMSIFWSAKEGLYKLYGKRGLDFKKDLKIFKEDQYMGEISKGNYHSHHHIWVFNFLEFKLVWVV